MTQAWFVCIDPVDKGKPVSYLHSVDFVIEADVGSAEYNALQAGQVINPQGENLIKWQGPFTTEAAAKTAQNPQPSPENPVAPVVQGVENSVPGLDQIGTFFGDLAQANTWVRVAEVALGVILVAIGLARITNAVPVATKIAKTVGMAA